MFLPLRKKALLRTILANSWQTLSEYSVNNPFMADQHSPNIRKMFTFHMQIRFAANTLCEQPANILRTFSEHESRVQIRYAANILQRFCEYAANMDSKLLTEYAANILRTFCKYAANMDSKLQIEYAANIMRTFCE